MKMIGVERCAAALAVLFMLACVWAGPFPAGITPAAAASQQDWNECGGPDPAHAIEVCARIIDNAQETADDRADAYVYRGAAYLAQDEVARAIASYTEAIELAPQKAIARIARAIAYERNGDSARAAADYVEANRLDPKAVADMVAQNPEFAAIAAKARATPPAGPGWIGIRIQEVTDLIAAAIGLDPPRGALVVGTTVGGPARAAGLRPGDVILRFDGVDITGVHELPPLVLRAPFGRTAEVVLQRRGAEVRTTITIGRRDERSAAAAAANAPAPPPEETHLLGLALSALSAELRERFRVDARIKRGVVVMGVEPSTQAAKSGLVAGEVVLEVTEVAVATPAEATAQVEARRKEGRHAVLLMVVSRQSVLRFVALSLEAAPAPAPGVSK
jgi:S1-C subfamily serine protease